ncbi:rod shape-determining protein MreD [Chachezhania sediminis]|uniref:rod shape-determining protein MreD n=1 Tax=Chachezhania sediminis TaxID=2599291 RepID=UPI0018EF2FCA|nr:rod shape-determining protein MreD [Chachezhania sediminis]
MILFTQLLPLDTAPRGWAAPDMLLCVTLAWSIRWPRYVPMLLVAGVALIADLLLQRPPGLMALLVVIASEYLKNHATGPNQAGLTVEWITVSLVMGAIFLAYRLVLGILGIGQAQVSLMLTQIVGTMLVYPLVAVLSRLALGAPAPIGGDPDGRGGRA